MEIRSPKIKVLGLVPSRGSQEESVSLLFAALKGLPPFLGSWPFLPSSKSQCSIFKSVCLTLTLLPSSYKKPCDYPESTYIIEENYPSSRFFFCLFVLKLINSFLAALGLCCCMWAFSSCGERRLTLRCGARASHCGGFFCCGARALGMRASVVVGCGL